MPPGGPTRVESRSAAGETGTATAGGSGGQPGRVLLPLIPFRRGVHRVLPGDRIELRRHPHLLHAVPVTDLFRLVERVLAVELRNGLDAVVLRLRPATDEHARAVGIAAGTERAVPVLGPREVKHVAVERPAQLSPVARGD